MKKISIYGIVEEVLEEGTSSVEISKQTSAYSRKFKEILNGLRIDPQYFKKQGSKKSEYEIPIEAKGAVKNLLLSYTSSPMKSVRKGKFEHLTFQDLKGIVECIKILLSYTLQGKTLLVELNKLDTLTQFNVKKSFSQMKDESIKELIEETESMLCPNFNNMLNQEDRVFLTNHYMLEIKHLNKRLREIIDIVHELREEEVLLTSDLKSKQGEITAKEERLEIHEQVVKELLEKGEDDELYLSNLKELKEVTGIKNEEMVVKELKELANNNEGTSHFKIVTNEDADLGQKFRTSEEVINEAVRLYYENREI
ncbi:hypothetical protein [Sediminibacillus halophilus]|uniref:Uncharacterized protein n=1 Tax=Sediminibacillus halophilus TaxID=482461 RepID=A0A1G9T507_9BACI|nr:hypothetical protein [Sediminibacillus halophilus]SDM42708.1 hypothetical protein SAMN05216244_2436 [Sediminibacillus halophilus]